MKNILLICAAALMLASCATTSNTRGSLYSKMYEEKPTTILVMPPINNTNHAEAKEYFYSSLSKPLCEKGYYVISPFMALDLLKQESAYDSEMFINGSQKTFKNFFGADAVLYTTISKWEKKSALSYIEVSIDYTLKSASTGEILWERTGDLKVSFSSGNNNGLLGMAIDMINTATADKIVAARRCNQFVLQDLPEGKYGPMHGKDFDVKAGDKVLKGTVKK
ncbi:MAG: DUF799 domain-containing protein [Muribaculaceae bacterium]